MPVASDDLIADESAIYKPRQRVRAERAPRLLQWCRLDQAGLSSTFESCWPRSGLHFPRGGKRPWPDIRATPLCLPFA
jgi:hypothetical protein